MLLALPAPAPPDSARLSGRAQHAPVNTWAYAYPPQVDISRRLCLDSARLDAKGRFVLRVPLAAGPGYYRLQFTDEKGYWPVPLAAGRHVQFEGDLRPSGPVKSPSGRFRGSPETDLEHEFIQTYFDGVSLKRQGKRDKALAKQAQVRQLVRRHADSFVAPYWTVNFLTQDVDQRVFVDSMTAVFRQRQPNSPYTRRLEAGQQRQVALLPGQPAPPFTLATGLGGGGGDSLRLHVPRGRYLLLHVWHVSALAPSVRTTSGGRPADLLPLYQWAQGRAVDFVSVGMSPDQLRWLAEVQREPGVLWPQALDTRGFRGPLAEAYGLNRSPSFVLIGPDARLVALGLDLDEVSTQLRQLLP